MEGLTLKQVRFAARIAEEEINGPHGSVVSATNVALSVGYSESCAAEMASHNLKNPKVIEAIEERRKELAAAAGLSPAWVLNQWMQIAAADPSDLVTVVVKCCAQCWALAMPDLPPNPECKLCDGEGMRFVRVADTKKLKGPARKLFAGAKQTKDGIEIKMRDQDAALRALADYLGMQNKSAAAVAVAVTGSKPVRADDLTDDELAAIVAGKYTSLGVAQGVQSAGELPSTTIEATLETV